MLPSIIKNHSRSLKQALEQVRRTWQKKFSRLRLGKTRWVYFLLGQVHSTWWFLAGAWSPALLKTLIILTEWLNFNAICCTLQIGLKHKKFRNTKCWMEFFFLLRNREHQPAPLQRRGQRGRNVSQQRCNEVRRSAGIPEYSVRYGVRQAEYHTLSGRSTIFSTFYYWISSSPFEPLVFLRSVGCCLAFVFDLRSRRRDEVAPGAQAPGLFHDAEGGFFFFFLPLPSSSGGFFLPGL
jgi:hypothetical protein